MLSLPSPFGASNTAATVAICDDVGEGTALSTITIERDVFWLDAISEVFSGSDFTLDIVAALGVGAETTAGEDVKTVSD